MKPEDVASVFAAVRAAFRLLRTLNAVIMADGSEPESAAHAVIARRIVLAWLPSGVDHLSTVMPPWVAGMERGA